MGNALRLFAATLLSFIATPVLGTLMPLIGVFIAGFAAGALLGSAALGAAAALLGSLPWTILFAKLVSLIGSMLGVKLPTWVLALIGLGASAAGGAAGGFAVARLAEGR